MVFGAGQGRCGVERARIHWTEYGIEAACLALFMASACAFGALLEHPASTVRGALPDADLRRALMGCAMGATAIGLIYSPWGKRSGAHMNPAVTLTFLRLGKVAGVDALGYIAAQFVGAVAGVAAMGWVLRDWLADPAVNFVVTAPAGSVVAAFGAELAISCAQMSVVLAVSNSRFSRHTGLWAGAGVAAWILCVAPISGMSMNPARTLGSALIARQWSAIWIYFVAPPLGMLLAGYLHRLTRGVRACAKLQHDAGYRCIFCDHAASRAAAATASATTAVAEASLSLLTRGEPSR